MSRRTWAAATASAAIAAAGYRAGALSGGAGVAATAIGAAILHSGWRGGVVLATFFVSGSALPRLFQTSRRFKSDAARNERQVIANGGVAATMALMAPVIGSERAFAGLAGSLAAATADTWATEIGATSRQAPRMVLSRRAVAPGLSGGVTARGNVGALAGAVVVGTLSGLLCRDAKLVLPVAVAGVVGAFADSVLGEILQAKYRDPRTGAIVEDSARAGSQCLAGGHPRVDNDVVNLACTFTGAALGVLLYAASRGVSREPTQVGGFASRPDSPDYDG